jgi:hypothetical protein
VEKNSLDCLKKTIKSFFSSSLTHKLNNPYQKFSMWNNTLNNNLNKRYYSSMAKDIKYSIKYKNEYELTSIQKEALIGIISSKPYSTLGISVNSKYPENNLNEYFITGFTDAEGSFRVRISQSKERKIG